LKKRKRYFTIMVVPHSEESTYSLRLPLYIGQFVVALFVLCLAGLLLMAYSYRNALHEAKEVQALRQINQVQQDEINAFAFETQKLIEQMGQIEVLAELVAERLGISLDNEEENEDGDVSSMGMGEGGMGEGEPRVYASRSAEGRVLDRAVANIEMLQSLIPDQTDSLQMLEEEVDKFVRRMAATPSIWPASGRFTSGFGMRRSPFNRTIMQFHSGIDIAGVHGSAIYATADGVITSASYRGGYGNLVTISHGYGFETYYAHLSGYAVSTGQWVKRGQVIAYMGRTGRVTGTHLHYEVRVNGVAVNPMNYIR
jgi:murein DD-endopeptidase MepM/ murein hydrolase activator NlpD